MTTTRTLSALRLGALLAAASFALAGCAAGAGTAEPAASAPSTASAAAQITLDDAWVKAADEGMTAGFGVLVNDADTDATLVGATTVAADETELHETTADASGDMMMREVDGGFVVPAGGTLTLEPGGNHLMLMGLAGALEAGDEVTFELEFSDGSTLTVTAPVKDFSGANENYDGGEEDMGH